MLRKIVVIVVLANFLLGCGGGLDQGKCEEGYFEQSNFEGGSYCVPLADEDGTENTISDLENVE